MQHVEISTAIKYTKELTLLYVEDDIEVQKHTQELFTSLFKSVVVANDGEEGLEYYKKNTFDIVVSDIRMPKMDGVALVKEIKELNANQAVIITSAYDDNSYLLDFINLHVSRFIHKPINFESLISTVYSVSKNIVNTNMIELYRKDLESKNVELKDKNDELQSLVRILDSKISQISKGQVVTKDIDFDELSISSEHLDELKELETDISGASVLISLSKNINTSNIQVLGDMFKSYSTVISSYPEYDELKVKIQMLSSSLSTAPENFIKRVEDISILLESFIYVLRMWRKNLVGNEPKKAFELHASMLNDISTIIAIIDGTDDEIESEM